MRIIEFHKLLSNEGTEECVLKNCNLVVDGYSFFYNAYEESKIPYVFGSDAKEFARYVRVNKLLKFKRANVKCYFVFKGGDNDIHRKILRTKTPKFDFESNHKFVPPLFMTEICLQMLEEAGINYTTCTASNKDDCIALAEALNCPVLSDNIEYCFQKVPYIPTALLRYTNPNNYITARQFKLQNFLEKYALSEKKFTIFAVLSDVHLYERSHFDGLLKTWDVLDENLYEQNIKLIKWLSEHSEEETLSDISKYFTEDIENETLFNQIQNLLDKMHISEWTVPTDYLYNDCKLRFVTPDPLWFEKGVASQNIAIPYINLYKFGFIQGSTAIENKDATDSIMIAMNIIVYAYNLLKNFQSTEINLYQDAENNVKINTADFNVRKPFYSCIQSVFEKGWKVVHHLGLFQYFLKENKINITNVSVIPMEARLILIALAYFNRKKKSLNIDVTKEVYCYLIYYSVSHKLRLYDLHKEHQEQSENTIQITEKYFKLNENEEREIFDGEKLKTFVELQYCILHMNYLNVLCGKVYCPTRYHRYINGPFVYKLLRDMEGIDVDQFIDSMFSSAPIILDHLRFLINGYNQLLGNGRSTDNWRSRAIN